MGPSSSPRKPVSTVKRTKLLKSESEEELVREETDIFSSNTSIISKVPEIKKTHNIVRRVSNTEDGDMIKDLECMESPITLPSDSRGSNSSRNSDFSVTTSEASYKGNSRGKSSSRSSSESRQVQVVSSGESTKSKPRAGSVSRKK